MLRSVADPRASGEPFVINPVFNGGTGARQAQDGLSTAAFPSGVRTTPTEVNEVTAPLIFTRRGSAGEAASAAGTW